MKITPSCIFIVQKKYFDQICGGLKTVEGRINKIPYANVKKGDYVAFSSDTNTFYAEVLNVETFPSFRSYLTFFGVNACLPGVCSVEEGEELYRSFPSYRESERAYGVIGIKIKKVDDETRHKLLA